MHEQSPRCEAQVDKVTWLFFSFFLLPRTAFLNPTHLRASWPGNMEHRLKQPEAGAGGESVTPCAQGKEEKEKKSTVIILTAFQSMGT